MGFFGGGDFVDYTYLKKRGLLKLPEEEKMPAPMDKQGMLDFTAVPIPVSEQRVYDSSSPMASPSAVSSTPATEMPLLGFLDSPIPAPESATNTGSLSDSGLQLNEVKLKLDDTMFKLDLLLDKIKSIEQRLGLG